MGDDGLYTMVPAEYSMTEEAWKKLDRKTLGCIRTWLDDVVYNHVENEETSKGVWEKLHELYDRKTSANKAHLIKKLVNLKYQDGKPITNHINEFQGVVNKLASMKLDLDDELRALLLLGSLPDSWETLVITVNNTAADEAVTWDQFLTVVLNEEERRAQYGNTGSGSALVTEDRSRGKNRGQAARGKSRGKSKERLAPKAKGKTPDGCWYCGKAGHRKADCRARIRDEAGNSGGDANQAAVVTPSVLVTMMEGPILASISDSDPKVWIVDSGASFHATPHRDLFSRYVPGDGIVKMGNDGKSQVIGMGDVILSTKFSGRLVLKDVRHIPDLRLNLISTEKLDEEGYESYFGSGCWKLKKGSLVIARGRWNNQLYKTEELSRSDHICTVEAPPLDVWHRRMAHVSEKG
ncbi:hypothetical protein L8N14_020250, partial [Serratia marcescens]|nr:hypothetical protein [Serratia marcescens]